jgi:hypothetical protein
MYYYFSLHFELEYHRISYIQKQFYWWRKPPTCRRSLTNFIIYIVMLYWVHLAWAGFELTTSVVKKMNVLTCHFYQGFSSSVINQADKIPVTHWKTWNTNNVLKKKNMSHSFVFCFPYHLLESTRALPFYIWRNSEIKQEIVKIIVIRLHTFVSDQKRGDQIKNKKYHTVGTVPESNRKTKKKYVTQFRFLFTVPSTRICTNFALLYLFI